MVAGDEPIHCFRPSIFTHERCYVLEADALVSRDALQPERVPLSEIDRIRVYRVPGGMGPWIRRAVLHLRSGKRLVLQSTHYVRLAVIEDRTETYRALLGSLLRRVPSFNPQVSITVGPSSALWVTWLVLLILSFVVTAAGVALWLAGDFPIAAVLSFGLVIGFLPISWRMVRGGRAHSISPDALGGDVFD